MFKLLLCVLQRSVRLSGLRLYFTVEFAHKYPTVRWCEGAEMTAHHHTMKTAEQGHCPWFLRTRK